MGETQIINQSYHTSTWIHHGSSIYKLKENPYLKDIGRAGDVLELKFINNMHIFVGVDNPGENNHPRAIALAEKITKFLNDSV